MARYCPDKRGSALYPECVECTEKNCERFFCMIVGSRTASDSIYDFFTKKMNHILQNHTRIAIVSGGARGIDSLAKRYAHEKAYEYYEFPADWDRFGKAAGPIRNEEMHKFISNFPKRGVVAFWDGKSAGTKTNFPLAKKYNNQIILLKI